jgi:hypothetical protein
MVLSLDPILVLRQDPKEIGHVSRSNFLGSVLGSILIGSCLRTQLSWVLYEDPRVMGPASGPIMIGSCLWIQFAWVLPQDAIEMGPASGPKVFRF